MVSEAKRFLPVPQILPDIALNWSNLDSGLGHADHVSHVFGLLPKKPARAVEHMYAIASILQT